MSNRDCTNSLSHDEKIGKNTIVSWKGTSLLHCGTSDFSFISFDAYFESTCLNISLVVQVVQDLLAPVPLDIPMALIKPQQACPTGEVYKVCFKIVNRLLLFPIFFFSDHLLNDNFCVSVPSVG